MNTGSNPFPAPLAPLALAVLIAWPLSGQAVQDDGDAGDRTLADVTVTARKIEERPQDVPFSLGVTSADEIEDRRLRSLENVLEQTVGVQVMSLGDAAGTALRIRGVGSVQRVGQEDSSVTIYQDGVPKTLANTTLNTLDIERVEVLKGPQGTLFGRSSEAGAINVLTRQPTRHFEGYGRVEYGNEHQRALESVLSGPLSATLAGRLALRYDERDHVADNVNTGKPLMRPRNAAARGKLLWQPAAGTDATLSLAVEEQSNQSSGGTILRPYGSRPSVDYRPSAADSDQRTRQLALEINHRLADMRLTSVSGLSKRTFDDTLQFYEGRLWQQLIGFQPDGFRRMHIDERLLSQELRLSSLPEAPLRWVAGVNAFDSEYRFDNLDSYDRFNPANVLNADIRRRFGSRAYALFGELTVPVGEAFSLTAGLRHTWEKKHRSIDWQANPDNPGALRSAADRHRLDEDYTTGRLALGYRLDPTTNLYAVLARGYKSSGFIDQDTSVALGMRETPYAAARVNSHEVGVKHLSADRRFGLNAALFLNRSSDDHLMVFDPVTWAMRPMNLDTRSRGFELDLSWQAARSFGLNAGLSFVDARIEGGQALAASAARRGNRLPDSPRWSAFVSATHSTPLAALDGAILRTTLSARHVGKRAADVENSFDLDAYTKVDLRVALLLGSSELYLWADNLFDKQYDLYAYRYPAMIPGGADATIGIPGRARMLGIGLAHHF
ncbi:MAG: TonB-dependent receptor [Rhodocyclaceae bacterium]|nr:TonB-dependent receptor [Rhodocyclaceae bacterium]